MFFQGRLIDAFKILPDDKYLKEIYGNILSDYVLVTIKMMKKYEFVASKIPLSVRRNNFVYLEDYLIITKMDNPEAIKNFITQFFKKHNEIRLKDILAKSIKVYKASN